MATVGADEVLGPQIVGTVRPGDMHGDAVFVLIETGHDMAPTDLRVVFLGPLDEHLNSPCC